MSQDQDFKRLQQKTYQAYHQDGLIDILIGMATIGFGIYMAIDNPAFLFMGWMPLILYVPLKNRLTVPRIGYVKFSTSRMRIFFSLFIAMLAVILLGGIFFFDRSGSIPVEFSIWIKKYYMLILGSIAALALCSAAFLSGISRLYGYALIFLVVFTGGIWLGLQPAIFVLASGVLIGAAGVWLLVRFLRKYPHPVQENAHE